MFFGTQILTAQNNAGSWSPRACERFQKLGIGLSVALAWGSLLSAGVGAELSRANNVAQLPVVSLSPKVRPPADSPVMPGASARTRALLAFLADAYGKRVLSGQQDGAIWSGQPAHELDLIQKATGRLPAIRSFEMGAFTPPVSESSKRAAPAVISRAKEWYQESNGIVALCWHWHAPAGPGSIYIKDTPFDLRQGLVEGTPEHAAMLRDLDIIAGELLKLQAADVPVLWRPLHEANGRWFWWGAQGPEPFKELWRLMFERFASYHKLRNLIWIFSPGCATDLAAWYPGDAYVDIIGQDHYPMDGNTGPAADIFEQLVELGAGAKLVAMSENGPIPDPEGMLQQKAGWLFFGAWSGKTLLQYNSMDRLAAVYRHPYVLNLDGLPDLKSYRCEAVGKAVKLGFLRPPTPLAVGGRARLPVAVAIQDARGQTVRGDAREVTLICSEGRGQSPLVWKAPTLHGLATFPDLSLPKAGDGYVLKAKAAGLKETISQRFEVGPGQGVLHEWWTNAVNVELKDLAFQSGAGMPPDGREVVAAAFEVPCRTRTNFAERFRACVAPPLSGNYLFQMVGDGSAELWLSPDRTPARKVKLAEIKAQTPYSKWPHSHEAWSGPVALEGGKAYYLEALHVQAEGLTQLWISWQLPDGSRQAPIPGARLIRAGEGEDIALHR